MNKLALIKFDADSKSFAGRFGIQETNEFGDFVNLFLLSPELKDEQQADQVNGAGAWSFVKDLGEQEDSDDFWRAVETAVEYLTSPAEMVTGNGWKVCRDGKLRHVAFDSRQCAQVSRHPAFSSSAASLIYEASSGKRSAEECEELGGLIHAELCTTEQEFQDKCVFLARYGFGSFVDSPGINNNPFTPCNSGSDGGD